MTSFERRNAVTTKQLTVERFSITSARPFAEVVDAIAAQVGHPDMGKFLSAIQTARDDQELQRIVNDAVGPTELMEFGRFDQGEVLRRELGVEAPNVIRLLIGNPLTMRKMVKHVHDAGSYAPVTILVDERPDGVHITYDRMSSMIAPYENSEALQVAKALDAKVEDVIVAAAQ
jgi:uncharacterized protein (DUF302 family)